MPFSSCLDSMESPIVLDTSVVINLFATGVAKEVFQVLPKSPLVTRVAHGELLKGTAQQGYQTSQDLQTLADKGIVEFVDLSPEAEATFFGLVSGSSVESLDDGEAATVAFASETAAWAAIDERKARRICRDSFPGVHVASTVDIFASSAVTNAFPRSALANAVYKALIHARMGVSDRELDWVVGLIGAERVGQCRSLPRRSRRGAA